MEFNLSPTEKKILAHLGDSGDDAYQQVSSRALSDELGLTLGQVLHALRVLGNCGLVQLADGKDPE